MVFLRKENVAKKLTQRYVDPFSSEFTETNVWLKLRDIMFLLNVRDVVSE